MEPSLAEKLHLTLRDSVQRQEAAGKPAILLVQGVLRPWIARFVRHAIPELKVLSYNEIPKDKQVRIVASVGN